MKIPPLDLKRQYKELEPQLVTSFKDVLASTNFILGPYIQNFEKDIAQYLSVKHTVTVSSGTDALILALKAVGVGKGTKVITTPFTFFATVSAILACGAEPIFADIDSETFQLDPECVEKLLQTDKTKTIKALMPVHLYGQGAEISSFLSLSKKYGVRIVEDACQAMGASYEGKKIGGFGDVSCFSFFPTKNLGCMGDGGLVSTQDDELVESIRMMRTHGSRKKYFHERVGSNYRMDALQAAILGVFLPHLDNWIKNRQDIAKFYDENLTSLQSIKTPSKVDKATHSYHQYTLRVSDNRRDDLKSYLSDHGIESTVYYPLPCHLQPALSGMGFKEGQFPKTEKAAKEVLSIPVFPGMTKDESTYVVQNIHDWAKIKS